MERIQDRRDGWTRVTMDYDCTVHITSMLGKFKFSFDVMEARALDEDKVKEWYEKSGHKSQLAALQEIQGWREVAYLIRQELDQRTKKRKAEECLSKNQQTGTNLNKRR